MEKRTMHLFPVSMCRYTYRFISSNMARLLVPCIYVGGSQDIFLPEYDISTPLDCVWKDEGHRVTYAGHRTFLLCTSCLTYLSVVAQSAEAREVSGSTPGTAHFVVTQARGNSSPDKYKKQSLLIPEEKQVQCF